MIKLPIATIVFIFILSCKNGSGVPDGVLPPKKMQTVLRDMMRADLFLNDYVLSRDSALNKDSTRINTYSQVLLLHQVTKSNFQKSLDYYKHYPSTLESILDSIGKAKAPTELLEHKKEIVEDTLSTINAHPESIDTPYRQSQQRKKLIKQL